MMMSESAIGHMMIVVLPVVTFYVFRNKDLGDNEKTGTIPKNRVFAIAMAAAFLWADTTASTDPEQAPFLFSY